MTKTFVVQHEHEWCGRDEVKLIGVYATYDDAQAAIDRLRAQPGFRNWPDGFSIDEYELGADHWTEGFITMLNILIPSRTNGEAYYVAGCKYRQGDLYEISEIADEGDAIFDVGDVVQCTETTLPDHGDRVLVATRVVRDGA